MNLVNIAEYAKKKKTFGVILLFIASVWAMWSEEQLTLTTSILTTFVAFAGAFFKAGLNRSEEVAEKMLEELKKIRNLGPVLILVLLPAFMLAGCPSKDIRTEVALLKKSHETYRKYTVPNPKLSAEDQARAVEVGIEIADSFDKLEKLVQ